LNDYEIRYRSADGQILVVFPVRCANDQCAHAAAIENFTDEFAAYEIRRGNTHIESGTHIDERGIG
jgi:hypothetical protein